MAKVTRDLLLLKADIVTNEKNPRDKDNEDTISPDSTQGNVKFEVYGEELVEKEVKQSGNSGRVYLPPDWVGHHVKIIRVD